jgi:hypothetical protein
MRLKLLGCMSAVALLAGISTASADIITVTWTGSLSPAGTGGTVDTNGLFGATGASYAGDPFSATLVFDSATAGAIYNPATGTLEGGSDINGSRSPGTPSPLVSASLTINGTSVSIGGGYSAQLVSTPGSSAGTASFTTYVQSGATSGNTELLKLEFSGANLTGAVPGFPIAINQNGSFTLVSGDGVLANQASQFFDNGETLTFVPASVTVTDQSSVAAVPEPSTWAMMLVGFGGLGFLSYRRSRRNGGLQFRFA